MRRWPLILFTSYNPDQTGHAQYLMNRTSSGGLSTDVDRWFGECCLKLARWILWKTYTYSLHSKCSSVLRNFAAGSVAHGNQCHRKITASTVTILLCDSATTNKDGERFHCVRAHSIYTTTRIHSTCSCTMATLTLGDRFWRLRFASTETVAG